jgi:hypothetical protein
MADTANGALPEQSSRHRAELTDLAFDLTHKFAGFGLNA